MIMHKTALVKKLLAMGLCMAALNVPAQPNHNSLDWSEAVGRAGTDRVVLPVNQVITPAGRQIELHGLRPQVLLLSPDGKILITSGQTRHVIVLDAGSGKILQKVALPNDGPLGTARVPASSHYLKPDTDEQVSYTGMVFSPDGKRLFLSNVEGSIKVFAVKDDRLTGIGSISLPYANAPWRKDEIPSGLAISADGQRLYVAGSLSNHLFEYKLPDGKLLRTFDTGEVPYTVVLAGNKAYVSNWAGRRPEAGSLTGPGGSGTTVRVDSHGAAAEGSVSVLDLASGKTLAEILTGRHASALLLTPDRRYVCVANANSDNVSVISTATDKVVETIPMRWQAQDLFGASPNALAMDPSGKRLYVADGTQNAVAVVAFHPGKSKVLELFPAGQAGNSRLLGLIPTGWYPGALAYDAARRTLDVANIKGTLPDKTYDPSRKGYNSHEHLGTLSLIPLPDKAQLRRDTITVFNNYRRAVEDAVFAPARPGQPARPVPERIGEPSVFQHVIYFIKENRTYDQVLGDVKEGDGDAKLCMFGERVTPNQHKMVHDFVLMDNMYCCGILSADGHEWADTAFATDYMEKSFANFPRSYPDLQDPNDFDAMAYSPEGFIWDDCLAHGKTVRDYGEATYDTKVWKDSAKTNDVTFLDSYRDFVNQTGLIRYTSVPGIASLAPYIMTNDMVGWDLQVPDVYRAAIFIRELKRFEAEGNMPNLIIMDLPNDHTSGTDPGEPTPAAMVADDDLAFGQILDALSHSQFWSNTCVFACEDDPQSGWDHVSGYRTTAYVVSAYTKRHTVIHVNYNQTSILRTIELMLGLPPMNQMDATATPMTDCFTDTPDFTPYNCVTNNIPLDQMNPNLAQIKNRRQYHDALVSSRLPWKKADQCPDDVLNHILWHAQMGFKDPYPEWAILDKGDD